MVKKASKQEKRIMKAQALSSDVQAEAIEIGSQMIQAKLTKAFVVATVKTAFQFEGVFNLMKMWAEESDQEERDETIAELQDLIDDCNQPDKNGTDRKMR